MPEVTETNKVPDFTKMSLSERSKWILAQLQKFHGRIVTDEEGRWLRLEVTTGLVAYLQQLAPALTAAQRKKTVHHLGKNGFYRFNNLGGGTVEHFVKLDEVNEFEPAGVDADKAKTAGGEADVLAEVDAALATLTKARTTIIGLRERLAERDERVKKLEEENADLCDRLEGAQQLSQKLTGENSVLRTAPTLTQPFRDGLAELQRTIDAGDPA